MAEERGPSYGVIIQAMEVPDHYIITPEAKSNKPKMKSI